MRNLLLDENNELHNRTMHISGILNNDIKADIEDIKADIEEKMRAFMPEISEKTLRHIYALYDECGKEKVFGRSFVEEITGLKAQIATVSSELSKCRKEVKMCDSITERSVQVQLNLEQIREQKTTQRKENERYEPSWRRSGTDREDVSEWR